MNLEHKAIGTGLTKPLGVLGVLDLDTYHVRLVQNNIASPISRDQPGPLTEDPSPHIRVKSRPSFLICQPRLIRLDEECLFHLNSDSVPWGAYLSSSR